MRDLLEELRTKDPACYEDIRRRVIIDSEAYDSDQTFRENVDDTIQGCLQRACIARQWVIVLQGFSESEYTCDLVEDDIIASSNGSSFTDALLKAYLEAIS